VFTVRGLEGDAYLLASAGVPREDEKG